MKILLNAEAFGFGPTSAISNIYNILNKEFKDEIFQIDYIGNKHTLDLQIDNNYNEIFDVSSFEKIIVNYDYFITAMDIELAKKAISKNIKTIFYDALLWFWNKIEIEPYCYIAQDFFGVAEKLDNVKSKKKYIVKPLVSKDVKESEKYNIINFAGLENPYFSIEETTNYIDNILKIILKNSSIKFDFIIGSKRNSDLLKEKYDIKTFSYNEMQKILSNTNNMICTSGLGNIYECDKYKINTIFLPPSNDSQGQQLDLLIKYNSIKNFIDWENINNKKINYFKNQNEVMINIKENINHFDEINFKKTFLNLKYQKINLDFNNNLSLYSIFKELFKY